MSKLLLNDQFILAAITICSLIVIHILKKNYAAILKCLKFVIAPVAAHIDMAIDSVTKENKMQADDLTSDQIQERFPGQLNSILLREAGRLTRKHVDEFQFRDELVKQLIAQHSTLDGDVTVTARKIVGLAYAIMQERQNFNEIERSLLKLKAKNDN